MGWPGSDHSASSEGGGGGLVKLLLVGVALAALAGGAHGLGGSSGASCAHLEKLWVHAGGSTTTAETAAAVAEAESSGNADATSSIGAEGYWQINPAAWPKLATYDPHGNARAAVIISKDGTNWQPWSSYTNGSYAGRC